MSTNFNVLMSCFRKVFFPSSEALRRLQSSHYIYLSLKWKVCWGFGDWRPRWVRCRWLSSPKQNITTKSVLIAFLFKQRNNNKKPQTISTFYWFLLQESSSLRRECYCSTVISSILLESWKHGVHFLKPHHLQVCLQATVSFH